MQILNYFPGQQATIFLETLNSTGARADGYITPFVSRIVFPDLSLATGFPVNMTKLDVGLYYFQFVLPINAAAAGSYLVDISYDNVDTQAPNYALYQIIVSAPFGQYSATTQ